MDRGEYALERREVDVLPKEFYLVRYDDGISQLRSANDAFLEFDLDTSRSHDSTLDISMKTLGAQKFSKKVQLFAYCSVLFKILHTVIICCLSN